MAYRRIDDSVPLDVDFRLAREGCVNLLSLLLPSSLGITLSSSCTLSLSLFSPSLSFLFSRTCVAVGHGAAHRRRYAPGCRGWLDSSRVVRSSIRRPSSPLLCSFSCLFPSSSNTFAVASLMRERHCYCRSCSLPLSDFPPSISYFLIWLI